MFLLAMAGLAQAATITVGPGAAYDFNTIQAGIDAAVDGDTVLVAPGEYVITEPITFRGKAITVKSEAGPDETTIRMGTPADTNRASVVVFENNETAASVLDGFTITGGTGFRVFTPEKSEYVWCGGGIYVANASSAIVRNCAIVQNSAKYVGGGVECWENSSATITNCTIAGNSTTEGGGGVVCSYGSSVTMTDCIIRGNSTGGVLCWGNSSVTMTYCIIRGNSAITEGGGGVLCWENSSVTMTYCTIAENSAGSIGGGVLCGENSSSVSMTHCAIINNMARIGGGGLETFHQASATVSNCIIAWNTALQLGGGGIVCAPYGYPGCSVTVTNSILWENTAPKGSEIWVRSGATFSISYSNVAGGQAGVSVEGGSALNWGAGNIDADPLFADPNNGDFHLKSQAGRWTSASSVEPDPNSQTWVMDDVTSLCIDAGDPNSDWTAELWPHGERINMGAYGGTSQSSRSLSDAGNVADLNRDGIVDSADMRIMVDHWGTDEPLCDIGPMPFGDGIVDIQDLIVLAEHLFEERKE
jgi:hypothetical protein